MFFFPKVHIGLNYLCAVSASPLPGGLLELLAFRKEPIGPYPEGVLVGWMCFFPCCFPFWVWALNMKGMFVICSSYLWPIQMQSL